MTTTPAAKSGYRACRCSEYVIGDVEDVNGQPEIVNSRATGCTKHVAGKADFAPGHDAKLKSLMILAKRTGRTVFRGSQSGSAEAMSAEYGFGRMVANCAERKPRGAKAAKAAQPSTVWAKVGRWAYEGVISPEGRFVYRDKSGREHATSQYRIADVLNTKGIQLG